MRLSMTAMGKAAASVGLRRAGIAVLGAAVLAAAGCSSARVGRGDSVVMTRPATMAAMPATAPATMASSAPQPVNAPAPQTEINPPEPVAATAEAPITMDDAAWHELLEQLAGSSFGTRAAAQKKLAALPPSFRDQLKKLADGEANPEVQARLLQRVGEMDTQLVIDPPPIAFHLHGGSLADVAAELAKETGCPFQATANGFGMRGFVGGGTYTLETGALPFWEIIRRLEAQHAFGMQQYPSGMGGQMTVQLISGASLHHFSVVKGLAIVPLTLSLESMRSLQNGSVAMPPALLLGYSLCTDPRVKVMSVGNPVFDDVRDDAGNKLIAPAAGDGINRGNMMTPMVIRAGGMRIMGQQRSAEFALPEKPGSEIAAVHGTLDMVVVTGMTTADVDSIETKPQTAIRVGERTLHVTSVSAGPNGLTIRASVDMPTMNGNGIGNGFNPSLTPITLTFSDATGRVLTTAIGFGQMMATFGGTYTAPFKLHVSATTGTAHVTLPFVLRHLPLPPLAGAAP